MILFFTSRHGQLDLTTTTTTSAQATTQFYLEARSIRSYTSSATPLVRVRVCFGRLRSFNSSRVTSAVCTIFTGFAAQSIRRSYPCITLSEQHPAPSGRNAVSPIAQQTYEAPYTRSIDQGASAENLYTSWAVATAGS